MSDQRNVILDAVRAMYTAVAQRPEGAFHFPVGRAACVLVGYPADFLDALPAAALESFAGVGYPFAANVIGPGDTVLDIGSGSGTDLLLAHRITGSRGSVLGLDLTDAMLEKLERTAAAAGTANVRLLKGTAEEIPLPDACVDVVTSNGVLNLVPDKPRAVAEIHRVLRPGGRVQIADIALRRPVGSQCQTNPQLWAECVVGATLEDEFIGLFRDAGFEQTAVLGHLDYFAASPSAETRKVAASFGAHSLVLRAVKPPSDRLPVAQRWPAAEDARTVQEQRPAASA